MNLFHFKVILAESLITRFSLGKLKFTIEEPQLARELRQVLKEPGHIVQYNQECRRFLYCFNIGNKDTKSFTYCKSCKASAFRRTKIVSGCTIYVKS